MYFIKRETSKLFKNLVTVIQAFFLLVVIKKVGREFDTFSLVPYTLGSLVSLIWLILVEKLQYLVFKSAGCRFGILHELEYFFLQISMCFYVLNHFLQEADSPVVHRTTSL